MSKIEIEQQVITAEWVTITPAAAKDWMARNTNIRKLNMKRANKIARDILHGNWQVNGESIKFDPDGNMTDGQTRVQAITIANKSVISLVVKGIKDTTNVDTGKTRSLSQILQNLGHQSSVSLAGAVNYFYAFEQAKCFNSGGSAADASYTDSLLFLEKNPTLLDSLSATVKTRTLFGRWSLHAALHFIFSQTSDRTFADDFYGQLISGVGLKITSPVYLLRERLIAAYRSDGRLKPDPLAGMVIKAWNYWFDNREVKSFQYSYAKDGIPAIKGFGKEVASAAT